MSMATQSHTRSASNVASSSTATKTATESAEGSPHDDIPIIRDLQLVEINSTQVNSESAALDTFFQSGFREEDSDEDDDDEPGAGGVDNDEESHIVDNAKTHDALAWADKFILETRRKGGRQTENSVLKQWKVSRNHERNSFKPSHCSMDLFSHGLLMQSTQVNYLT
jgi:hypothetical protein